MTSLPLQPLGCQLRSARLRTCFEPASPLHLRLAAASRLSSGPGGIADAGFFDEKWQWKPAPAKK